MAPAPPPSPEIAAQASPDQAQSAFSSSGVGQPGQGGPGGPGGGGAQQLQQFMQVMQKLDAVVGEAKNIVESVDPSLLPYLQQIGSAATQMLNAAQEKAQRSGATRGSPVVPPNAPQTPGGPPAMPAGM